MKINKKLAISVGVCGLVIISAAAFLLPESVNAEPPRRREYAVKNDNIIVGIDAAGSISSQKQNHYVDTPLQIDEYMVAVGDSVKKGDAIASLSQDDIAQKLRTAADELRTKQAALAKQTAERQALQQSTDKQINNLRQAGETAHNANINTHIAKRDAAELAINEKNTASALSKSNIAAHEAEKTARGTNIAAITAKIADLNAKNAALQQEIDVFLADTSADHTAEIEQLTNKKLENELLILDCEREKARLESTDYDALIAAENQLILQNDAEILKLKEQINSANGSIAHFEEQRKKDKENENKEIAQIEQQAKAQAAVLDSLVCTAQAAVDNAKTEYENIKKYADNPIITAECDGVITKLGYTAKAITDKINSLAEIGIESEKTLLLQIDPADIADVEEGQEVSFYVDAYPDSTFNGTVKSKSYLQNDNGKFAVTVEISASEQELLDGMGANATLIIKQKLNVITVSNKAVFLENNKSYVNIMDENGDLQKKEIKTGFSNGRITEVLEGLINGDTAWVEERYEN